ncbi:Uncharacterized protein Fot_10427 [Forsythia ovata]|uniref:Uncharacterized protein n=1 Tax=Forsythia ovata TaxID=205694 RepID=A0ABD1WH57_9LAMI
MIDGPQGNILENKVRGLKGENPKKINGLDFDQFKVTVLRKLLHHAFACGSLKLSALPLATISSQRSSLAITPSPTAVRSQSRSQIIEKRTGCGPAISVWKTSIRLHVKTTLQIV